MKTCETVMTKNPLCCQVLDTVENVAQLMKTGNIGSVPVIENEHSRKLIGIITDRDLAMKVVAEGCDAKTTRVEKVMTQEVVTCLAGDDLQKALDAMSKHQLRRIPIVDSDNRIVGIIAQADVATRLDQPESTAEVVKDISQAGV